ncbi:MFS transporter, partial [Streptomyces sp. NPDC056728]
RVLLVCLAAGATTMLDPAVVNIAAPSMRQSPGAGAGDVSLDRGRTVVGLRSGARAGRQPRWRVRAQAVFFVGVAVFLLAGWRPRPAAGPAQ